MTINRDSHITVDKSYVVSALNKLIRYLKSEILTLAWTSNDVALWRGGPL